MKLQHIYQLVHVVPEEELSVSQIVSRLQRAFSHYPWIKISRKVMDFGVSKFGVAGTFDPDASNRGQCRVIVHYFNGNAREKVKFHGRTRQMVLFQIFTTIMHERIHLLQNYKMDGCPRPYKPKKLDRFGNQLSEDVLLARGYYGATDELDAFAFTSALECKYGRATQQHLTSDMYKTAFSIHDTLYKRFLKRRYKYLLTLPLMDDINKGSKGDDYGRING